VELRSSSFPKLVFERLHLPGKRRLRQIQPCGGTMQAAFFDNDAKRAKLKNHELIVMQVMHHGNR